MTESWTTWPPWPSLAAPRRKKPPLKLLLLKLPLLKPPRPLKLLRLLTLLLRPLKLPRLLTLLLRPLKLRLLPSNQTPSGLMQKGCSGTPFLLPPPPPDPTGTPS